MRTRRRALAVVSTLGLLQLAGPLRAADAVTLPAGFSDTAVVSVPAPTGLAWTPDGRMLVTEQTGQLRVVRDGALNAVPALDLAGRICSDGERGLQSVLVDPAFATNRFVYLYWTHNAYGGCPTRTAGRPENRVARYVLVTTTRWWRAARPCWPTTCRRSTPTTTAATCTPAPTATST
ncbi:MAG: PQQ-dependent sugar dehydrogenase [Mycobacteriales bacterium]